MKRFVLSCACTVLVSIPAPRAQEQPLKVGWSIYPGWMDNALMEMKLRKAKPSFLEERCKEYGAEVDIVKFKEYIPSIEALAAGGLDACTMTLGEALSIPVDSGVPVTCILVNDYSNGNDAVCVPKGWTWADLKGKALLAEEYSVSQYLVWRGLQKQSLPLDYLNFRNTPGDECSKIFISAAARGRNVAVATWNPHVLRINDSGKADLLFTSREIPREIIDAVLIRTDRIRGREKAILAYLAAHYDVMGYFTDKATRAKAVRAMTFASEMKTSDATLFESMLDATHFYTTAAETIAFMEGNGIRTQHDRIRTFLKTFNAFKARDPDSHSITFDASFLKKVN